MHISSLSAGIFTDLAYSSTATLSNPVVIDDVNTPSEWTEIQYLRELPEFGTPNNVINVPVYGQTISSQIQAQADAPTLTIGLNYIPEVHNTLQGLVGDGVTYAFRLRLANTDLPQTLVAETVASVFVFRAQIGSFLVTPSLSDSMTASMTLTIDGDFSGPLTVS